ncbi:glycosyltransferase [Reichenbachiella ulvae]|uniref:Glycosyltransferase n=1 Tax=Reichenbachiella ulvae TaxID=2980104 RepID=A0ABT3CTG7_9BACT|nr:glycosyltransferase [Reichenbachiella ulvae]MCV9386824.1 glycosyltransferase [Reichenbachiella ulvae]
MFTLLDCNNFWSPSGGGVRRYHLEKMEYFKDRSDVKYVFIMHDDRTYTEQIGPCAFIEHLEVPKVLGNWEYRYLLKASKIAPLIVKHNPDVIEVGSPYFMPGIVNSVVNKYALKAKVFGFWHADFPVTYVKRFLKGAPFSLSVKGEKVAWAYARKNYNRMAGVVASSQIIIDRMIKNGIKNTHFVPLGVNENLFNPNKRNVNLVSELKAGTDERLIMFFPHRFCKEKGLHILLKAYPILCEKLSVEPALILAGMGPDQDSVEQMAEQFEHVHFKGFIKSKEEMAEYYASADLGFALSAWETFGLSLVESLSAGLPLVAASDGAAKEHIDRSGAGIVLDQVNVEELVNAIIAFNNDSNRDGLKMKARDYAKELSWENCFDKQLAVYQSTSDSIV